MVCTRWISWKFAWQSHNDAQQKDIAISQIETKTQDHDNAQQKDIAISQIETKTQDHDNAQ